MRGIFSGNGENDAGCVVYKDYRQYLPADDEYRFDEDKFGSSCSMPNPIAMDEEEFWGRASLVSFYLF